MGDVAVKGPASHLHLPQRARCGGREGPGRHLGRGKALFLLPEPQPLTLRTGLKAILSPGCPQGGDLTPSAPSWVGGPPSGSLLLWGQVRLDIQEPTDPTEGQPPCPPGAGPKLHVPADGSSWAARGPARRAGFKQAPTALVTPERATGVQQPRRCLPQGTTSPSSLELPEGKRRA